MTSLFTISMQGARKMHADRTSIFMLTVFKKTVCFLVISTFFAMILFVFGIMDHGGNDPMSMGSMSNNQASQDCPLIALGGGASCPKNSSFSVIHHMSVYRVLFSTPMAYSDLALVLASFFVISTMVAFFRSDALVVGRVRRFHDSLPLITASRKKIARWFSLLEHSPFLIQ